MNKQQHLVMKILQKIQVFQGLSVEEAGRLFQICKSTSFEPGTQVYTAGQPSVDMLVLVQGKMQVVSGSGQVLAEILPGSSTGEMGVFTGHRRAATIVVLEKSLALVIDRESLRNLMNRVPTIKSSILENVVELLSDRLAEANDQVAQLRASTGDE